MTTDEKLVRDRIIPPYYPIVYVRGYAMTRPEIEETFNDTYYGFAATSVEKRETAPSDGYLQADLFEGQLIRFMKNRDYGYADASNRGLHDFHANPSRGIWISRFYDTDFIRGKVRDIVDHATELADLIINRIPAGLKAAGISEASIRKDYKVILIAHSMGGLVCRTLIQNILKDPSNKVMQKALANDALLIDKSRVADPAKMIHRLVTMGTPHKGIDLGRLPDAIEDSLVNALNPFDSGMFKPKRMRDYLKLGAASTGAQKKALLKLANDDDEKDAEEATGFQYDLHSLGTSGFPVKRCLCIIGSDYNSYSAVKLLTGSRSDGLVKQSRAYVVGGPRPMAGSSYDEASVAFTANVHRAHSGHRGIVNSIESYENIQRFLFGNIVFRISLGDVTINTPVSDSGKDNYFYDFEVALSIRNTGVYLHRRAQDPCENAIRYERGAIPKDIYLHAAFLNSDLRSSDNNTGTDDDGNDPFSRFILQLRVKEYRTRDGWLWDTSYPAREIYAESIEIGVQYNGKAGRYDAEYHWQSDMGAPKPLVPDAAGTISIPLRKAASMSGNLVIISRQWPDAALTKD